MVYLRLKGLEPEYKFDFSSLFRIYVHHFDFQYLHYGLSLMYIAQARMFENPNVAIEDHVC